MWRELPPHPTVEDVVAILGGAAQVPVSKPGLEKDRSTREAAPSPGYQKPEPVE